MSKEQSNKSDEDLIKLSQLRWHCRRGVKELDVVLSNYLENHYLKSNSLHQDAYKYLLSLEDPILMALIFDEDSYDVNVLQNEEQHSVLSIIKNPYSN